MTLNQEQQTVVDVVIEAVNSFEKSIVGLQGAGGVGKTYTAKHICEAIGLGKCIGLAPSNEAKNLLALSIGVPCRTVAGFLKKEPEYDESGILQFLTKKQLDMNPFDGYSLAIVDESSMISKSDAEEIENLFLSSTCQVLLCMYDEFQHFPIKEKSSYLVETTKEDQLELLIQNRQTGDNPITNVIAESRQAVIDSEISYDPRYNHRRTKINELGRGYYSLKRAECLDFVASQFLKSYETEDYNLIRAIAYKNRTVEQLNKTIREKLVSLSESLRESSFQSDYFVGEILIAKKPISVRVFNPLIGRDQTVTAIDNASICLLTEMSELKSKEFSYDHYGKNGSEVIRKTFTFEYYEAVVKSVRNKVTVEVEIPTLKSRELWQQVSEQVRQNIVATVKINKDTRIWKKFFQCLELFNDLQHAYAITTHNSQGNSFNSIYVDCNCISTIPDKESQLRGFYVALSRAKERIYVSRD